MTTSAHIAALLKQRTGLDAGALGPGAIARAVHQRLDAASVPDHQAYWLKLHGEPEEFQALVEAVVVPETWFFRHREALLAFGRFALERLRSADGRPLRVLSLPCSTGEEPYSIVMALLDAGVPAGRFQVDAVDISALALEHARVGRYGDNAFRSGPLDFRNRYFRRVAAGYALDERVRACVRLRHGNLLDPRLLEGEPPYDFVFCRNLLIYFDPPTQRQAAAALARFTRPDGLVFVGPAEASLMTQRGFHSAGVPLAFAFRMPGFEAQGTVGAAGASAAKLPPAAPPRPARPVFTGAPATRASAPRPVARPGALLPAGTEGRAAMPDAAGTARTASAKAGDADADTSLAHIAALADGGALDTAMQACLAWLKTQGDSAAAYCLLGILQDASMLPALARESYRKALYLDPTHEEALHHLAALLDAEGDADGAARLRQRAQRHAQGRRHA